MMLIMVTSPIKSFFMHSLDLLAASKSDWKLTGCPIAFKRGSLHARADISRNETLWNVGRGAPLIRLDARELDHLCPFFRFSRDISAELRGGEYHGYGAEVGEP